MKRATSIALVLLAGAMPAIAQTTTTPPSASPTVSKTEKAPAPVTSGVTTAPTAPIAPVAGANSFTENQARARLEKSGFTNVTGLKKDDAGVWRGTASKNGKTQTVSLDFKGNVIAN